MSTVNNGNPLGVLGGVPVSIDEADTAADGDPLAGEPCAEAADGRTIPVPADYYDAVPTEEVVIKETREQELARLARAAEAQPENAACAQRYIEALLARGMQKGGLEAWRAAAARVDARDAYAMHLGVARALLDGGAYWMAREVLEAVQPQGLAGNIELNGIWSELQHMEEGDHLGFSIFPLCVQFDARWRGPHLRKELVGDPGLLAWYPGKIEGIKEEVVVILFGMLEDGDTTVVRAELERDVFEASGISFPEGIAKGQFIEIYVLKDGDGDKTEVALHQHRLGIMFPPGRFILDPIDLGEPESSDVTEEDPE